jgi:phosphomannomutase
MLDPAAFKAYDLRGSYPDQIDEAGAYVFGRAFAIYLEPRTVAVGRDMRTMAPTVMAQLIRGLREGGVDVLDIGMVATEVLYDAVASRGLDGGIQVTASHNPAGDIGFKVVRRDAQPIGLDSGLDKVREIATHEGGLPDANVPVGGIDWVDQVHAWRDRVDTFWQKDKVRPLRVVMDAGNGMGGAMAEPLLKACEALELYSYNFEPDGTFPNHEPNPLLPENRQFIIERVLEHEADLGIAWDGDADRCFFIDGRGEFVPGDFVTALLGEYALRRHPGAKILYDVRASRAVADRITAAGGTAIPSRVGHAFIKQRLRAEKAVFAGEVSGHYYFADFHGVDTGVVPALIMLQLVSESGGPLSELVADLRAKYFISGEINTAVDDVPMKLQQIKETYRDAEISHIDGVSVDYDDWHFNVRPSNTEPLLRLNLEAFSREEMEERRDEVLGLIRSASAERIGHR